MVVPTKNNTVNATIAAMTERVDTEKTRAPKPRATVTRAAKERTTAAMPIPVRAPAGATAETTRSPTATLCAYEAAASRP